MGFMSDLRTDYFVFLHTSSIFLLYVDSKNKLFLIQCKIAIIYMKCVQLILNCHCQVINIFVSDYDYYTLYIISALYYISELSFYMTLFTNCSYFPTHIHHTLSSKLRLKYWTGICITLMDKNVIVDKTFQDFSMHYNWHIILNWIHTFSFS